MVLKKTGPFDAVGGSLFPTELPVPVPSAREILVKVSVCHTELDEIEGRTPPSTPALFTDAQAAPLLCAGAIGYRSLTLTGIRNIGPTEPNIQFYETIKEIE